MATAFNKVADNAVSTTATSYSSIGVTSTVVASGTGTKFPAVPFIMTIWNGAASSDPGADTSMEEVTVTAKSTDTLTHTATVNTHTSAPNVANLMTAAQITTIQSAINTLESAPSAHPTADCVVAASGGDYTTVVAAYAAGKRVIEVVGAVTETLQLSATARVTLFGKDAQSCRITLPNDVTKLWSFTGSQSRITGVTFVGGNINLTDNRTSWVFFKGNHMVIDGCGFEGQGSTTTTTGNMVGLGKYGVGWPTLCDFTNNYFTNLNRGNVGLFCEIAYGGDGLVRIDGNTFDSLQGIGAISIGGSSLGSADSGWFSVSSNQVYPVSASYTGADCISVTMPSSSSGLIGFQVCHNKVYSGYSGGTSYAIRIQGTVSSDIGAGAVIGNTVVASSLTTGGKACSMSFETVTGAMVTGNSAAGFNMFGNLRCSFVANAITQVLYNTSGTNDYCVFSGNSLGNGITHSLNNFRYGVLSGNAGYGAAAHMDYCTDCNISDNNFDTGSLTVQSGANNVLIGNRCSTLTLSGTGHLWNSNLIGTFTNTSTAPVPAGITVDNALPTVNTIGNYTVTLADYNVNVNAGAGAKTITLLDAIGNPGNIYLISKSDSSANTVTVAATSSQLINGASTFVLGSQYKFVSVISNGANWVITGSN